MFAPSLPNRTELLAKIEAFLAETQMNAAVFGRKAMGDPRFVYQLRKGREPRERTIKRAIEKIAAHPLTRWDLDDAPRARRKAA